MPINDILVLNLLIYLIEIIIKFQIILFLYIIR